MLENEVWATVKGVGGGQTSEWLAGRSLLRSSARCCRYGSSGVGFGGTSVDLIRLVFRLVWTSNCSYLCAHSLELQWGPCLRRHQ